MSVRGSPITTVFPPPSGSPAAEFLYVIPRDRRRTSVSAASSESYVHIRIPPSAGPSVVSCTAISARSPASGSWQITTCSCSLKSRKAPRV